jgi:hypothetical protein
VLLVLMRRLWRGGHGDLRTTDERPGTKHESAAIVQCALQHHAHDDGYHTHGLSLIV